MAVLDVDIAQPQVFGGPVRRHGPGRDGPPRYVARVWHAARRLLAEDLPADVRDEEVSVVLCFQGSVLLNVLLGGDDDMTFSARCHLCCLEGGRGARLVWRSAAAAIDLACAVLRGEHQHCATAWENHMARFR